MAHSTGMLAVMAGSATPTTTPSPLGQDEVDQPMDGWVESEEEVITEFHDEDNREKKQVCIQVLHIRLVTTLYLILCALMRHSSTHYC